MNKIIIPDNYNYIGLFLTFNCNLKCDYCINKFYGNLKLRNMISGRQWIEFINRIETRDDLPVTLQGGEPSLHQDFYEIINGIKKEINIDLMTNLQFDIKKFMKNVKPDRMKRDSPYASIRVSYHPQTMNLLNLLDKVIELQMNGYSVGIWSVNHPNNKQYIDVAIEKCNHLGIDFRIKQFLGWHNGKLYGKYKYKNAITEITKDIAQIKTVQTKIVLCKTTELLISPLGVIHRCHSDLYKNINPISYAWSNEIIMDKEIICYNFGLCNPCDIKIKTNRFQKNGHISVTIDEI